MRRGAVALPIRTSWLLMLSLTACASAGGARGTGDTTPQQGGQGTSQAATPSGSTGAPEQPLDPQAIGSAIGMTAHTTADGVVRVTWPRTEVPVNIDGVAFPPAAGLTSWAAFAPADGGAMLMGDTVVFQDEVSPAMDAAFARGLEISALHNHFFFDRPKVYFMHLGGHGEAAELARGVKAVWDAIREVRRQRAEPASTFSGGEPAAGGALDAAHLGEIIGVEPSVNDGVVKLTIPREATMHGARFGGAMGLTTWAAFTGSDAMAAMDGDFAMTGSEVQTVLRALRRAGIHVVALHNQMIGETPAYYFTHFWAKGPAAELARGYRAARTRSRRGSRPPRRGTFSESAVPRGRSVAATSRTCTRRRPDPRAR